MIQIQSNSGSDVVLTVTLTDDSGPVDLTGRSAVVFDVPDQLLSRVSAVITNPATGVITVSIEGSNPLPVKTYTFRVQISQPNGSSIGLPLFQLSVK
jgi:hypothetical protein